MGWFLGHERDAAVGAPAGSRLDTRIRTTGTTGSVRPRPASVRGRVGTMAGMPADSTTGKRFHVETLGCPKNAVDSDKVIASLLADGLTPADSAADADLVVVNTCAFIEAARQESIDVALALSDARKPGARSWSPVAWPSATATSSRPRCRKPMRSSGSPTRARSSTS